MAVDSPDWTRQVVVTNLASGLTKVNWLPRQVLDATVGQFLSQVFNNEVTAAKGIQVFVHYFDDTYNGATYRLGLRNHFPTPGGNPALDADLYIVGLGAASSLSEVFEIYPGTNGQSSGGASTPLSAHLGDNFQFDLRTAPGGPVTHIELESSYILLP